VTASNTVEVAAFIDSALQYEASWQRAEAHAAAFGDALGYYGSSVGVVRGTLRDASRRYPGMTHDDVTALSSELWSVPVYERRLAAVVLLQSSVAILIASDLTRLEGFLRTAGVDDLVDRLGNDVIVPLLGSLDARDRARAHVIIARWETDRSASLQRVARLVAVAS
jgi:hypothetical protein